MSRYCVIDFETTGLDPAVSEVIEYAAVRVCDGEIGLHLASLCRPEAPIPYEATRVHGITDRMVRFAEPFLAHLPGLVDFIGSDTVVAHNVPFDMGFLSRYCARAKIECRPRTLCTLRMARRLFPMLPSRALTEVARHLGVTGGGAAHRALGDAMVTARVLLKMLALAPGAEDLCEDAPAGA
ncbi:MAG: 3'-5' exonuclease [Oscillospiraceae bacterium]|nr:3'-5' exonuclease [Oscillospiraceae bacterium]